MPPNVEREQLQILYPEGWLNKKNLVSEKRKKITIRSMGSLFFFPFFYRAKKQKCYCVTLGHVYLGRGYIGHGSLSIWDHTLGNKLGCYLRACK